MDLWIQSTQIGGRWCLLQKNTGALVWAQRKIQALINWAETLRSPWPHIISTEEEENCETKSLIRADTVLYFKGIVHLKMNTLSSFTQTPKLVTKLIFLLLFLKNTLATSFNIMKVNEAFSFFKETQKHAKVIHPSRDSHMMSFV